MDNSLIPRAFSPTDAKREREANARLAERQSSARNMSTSSIPAGGSLGLGGNVDVEPGGNINLSSGGGINVAEGGRIQLAGKAASRYALNNPGQPILPYDTTTVLGTQTYVDTDGRTYVAPGVYLTHPVDASTTNLEFRGYEISLGYKSADNANVNRLSMSDVAARVESLKSGPGGGVANYGTYLELRQDGLIASSTSPDVRAVDVDSRIRFKLGNTSGDGLPAGSAGALLGWTDTGAYARYRTNNAGGHWVETLNGAATETTSVGTAGDGKLTIQATNGVDIVGALTNNGAPISGGGSYPTDNITLTNTLQAATVKATGQVQGATAAITGRVDADSIIAQSATLASSIGILRVSVPSGGFVRIIPPASKFVAGTASGTLTPATGWINLGPTSTVPANYLGLDTVGSTPRPYRIKVTVQGCGTPVSGGTFAVRALFNGATANGGLSQAPYSTGNFTTSVTGEFINTTGAAVTVTAQIIALIQNVDISTGAAISYYNVEVSPYNPL